MPCCHVVCPTPRPQSCGVVFSCARLLPMGSHPRVADKRSTYDLFGPVSKLWSSNYDRAMICFLACLKVGWWGGLWVCASVYGVGD